MWIIKPINSYAAIIDYPDHRHVRSEVHYSETIYLNLKLNSHKHRFVISIHYFMKDAKNEF